MVDFLMNRDEEGQGLAEYALILALIAIIAIAALIFLGGQISTILSTIGAQIRPRPWVAMKLTTAGVACSAAEMKSPSFSRLSSSTMISISPSRNA